MQSPLIFLSDLLWRGLALLWLCLAPYAGAVEVAPPSSILGASVRLGVAALLFAAFGMLLLRLWRRSRVAAGLLALAALAAVVLGVVLSGEHGPLGRGLVWVGLLAWSGFAVAAAGPVADLMAKSQARPQPDLRERMGFALAVVLLGALSVAASWRRVGSSSSLLRAAVAADPGNEQIARPLAQAQESAGDHRQASETLKSCALANPGACQCAAELLKDQLERGAYADAGSVLTRLSPTCRAAPGFDGMVAETLADANILDAARKAADIALGANRKDPYALCAKGMLALKARDFGSARSNLEQAIAAGRGSRARVLLGLVLFQAGDLDAAKPVFEQVIKDDPTNVPALYDLALIEQAQNHYHQAREGYLLVLHLDPRNADARFNLGVLAHDAKVYGEASHDLSELEKLLPPDDARVVALQKMLAN